jgi:hypothetical protein
MTTIPRLPGITIVASGGDASGATRTVSGYLTAASAKEFGAALPEGWYCDDATLSSNCAVEPMMTLWYYVQDMALNGTAHQQAPT